MEDQFSRTRMLLGDEGMGRLKKARVAVFGIGGVGGYASEALARSGVGALELVDKDTVSISNLNRQITALHSSVGRYKTEVMKERILDICPGTEVAVHNCFFLPENAGQFDFSRYSYVVDAVDTVTAKLEIILRAKAAARFQVTDVYSTEMCPLAKVMRRELKKRGVENLKVVYSPEPPRTPLEAAHEEPGRRAVPGSTAFVPPVAGLILAGEVIRDLVEVRL